MTEVFVEPVTIEIEAKEEIEAKRSGRTCSGPSFSDSNRDLLLVTRVSLSLLLLDIYSQPIDSRKHGGTYI
ncbi:MAG: hypothetical protein WAK33_06940, partial [Silvibacterium sp.]